MTHPGFEITKRYYAVVDAALSNDELKSLERGVLIEGGKTAPAHVRVYGMQPGRTELTITIHEGRNRQVRRMFEAIGKKVLFLKRISEGQLNLGNLHRGEYRLSLIHI